MAPFVGGAEVAAERLALGLQDAGHDVLLVLGKRGPVQERMERAGLRCLHRPMYFTDKRHWVRYVRARSLLRRTMKAYRPDVIHSNDLPTHQIVSDAARGLGIPRICHHRFPFGGEGIDWLNKFGAERHLFVSRALMEEMSEASERLQRAPRAVVYDGLALPPRPTEADRRRAREQLGLSAERTIAIFAGQIIERKGVADLIRGWSSLDSCVTAEADLYVIGEDLQENGRYRREMERLSGELSCQARFLGFREDVDRWLVASDLAVVPSHVEPLGNASLEAMSHALPVIGSAVGGIREIIVHEETGLLVAPRSPDQLAGALARLLIDREARSRFGAAGRRRCEDVFGLSVHVRRVIEEYQRAARPCATAGSSCASS
jgi:glycosyltransferase involved in cell wall biosynthesis